MLHRNNVKVWAHCQMNEKAKFGPVNLLLEKFARMYVWM